MAANSRNAAAGFAREQCGERLPHRPVGEQGHESVAAAHLVADDRTRLARLQLDGEPGGQLGIPARR